MPNPEHMGASPQELREGKTVSLSLSTEEVDTLLLALGSARNSYKEDLAKLDAIRDHDDDAAADVDILAKGLVKIDRLIQTLRALPADSHRDRSSANS